MTLVLQYNAETSVPVEVEGITPDAVRDKSLDDIRRLPIFHGKGQLPLGEMFTLSGDASDERMVWEGNLAGVHWIGAKMSGGRIEVSDSAGRHLGSEMQGGEIHVQGNAGDWVGAEMHSGLIHIRGSAGHLVGAAYRGSARGVTGGTILVEGSAGHEVGHTMRRGMIAIVGEAGDFTGFNLIAGSLFVFGQAGIRPGAGMHRGTIALLGGEPPKLLPSFRRAGEFRLNMLTLAFQFLRERGLGVDERFLTGRYSLFHGDLVALGRGEVILPDR